MDCGALEALDFGAFMNDESPKSPSAADRFRKMAERLDHNAADGFGGCFLIVPPTDGGDVIETLILDSRQDPTQYWILLKSKCEIEIARLDQSNRSQNAFGRR